MQAIGIEADGGVKGCLSLQPPTAGVDRFREASLRDASLEELWYRPGIFAFNRDFTAAQLRGACRSCAHAALCRGGARCVGVAVTGDVGEDPYCYHRLLTQPARDRGWRRQAAAAAAAVVLGLGGAGCGDRALLGAEPGVDAGPDAHVTLDARADGGGPDAISCEDICCLCEYGFGPPGPSDEWLRCCAVDYGVAPPPDGGAIGRDAAPPVTAADAGGSDAINCEGVCCGCDYGAEPPPGCCHG
jgi:radical SAM protein with 4Fe4S-binding SPASM domain